MRAFGVVRAVRVLGAAGLPEAGRSAVRLSAAGLLAAGLLAISLFAGCAGQCDPSPQGMYACKCQRCHEVDGSGATASRMAGETIDLRAPLFQQNVSDVEIARIIRYGEGDMEPVEGLTQAEVDSIILHVRRLGRAAGSGLDKSGAGE